MSYQQIADHVYYIGDQTTHNGLDCNPYLIIDGDEAVLFEPGSSLDFEAVYANIKSLVSLDQIKYIVLTHEDPDLCISVPLLEKEGVDAQIVTSWRTMTLIQYYGIQSPMYLIEEHEMKLVLKSGRVLSFLMTPYLHFAGSFVTLDRENGILFSSDLFGAFSYNHTLYADDDYLGKMLSFHEHYMPSNEVLRPIMDVLLLLPIQMILPQHGSVITKRVRDYIHALRTLECGTILTPIKKNLMESGGFVMVFNEVYTRLRSIYPPDEVQKVVSALDELEFDAEGQISGYKNDALRVWEHIFEVVAKEQGMIWITVLEPFVRNLCAVYDLELPRIFTSAIDEVVSENERLQMVNLELDQTVRSVQDRLIRCPVTGLHNESFFRSLLLNELENQDWRDLGLLACVSVDGLMEYKLKFGSQEEENLLKNMAYLLKEMFSEASAYRLEDVEFGLYVKGLSKESFLMMLDEFRTSITRSDLFLDALTISAGVAFPNEIKLDQPSLDSTADSYMELALSRLSSARSRGRNNLCYEGDALNQEASSGKVLLVDSDQTNLDLLHTFLSEMGIEVLTAKDGIEALSTALESRPDVVVSEIILNKMDGFLLREEMLKDSRIKDIQMVFLSYRKDEESVERALNLGVTYYLQKPYLLKEMLGIIKKYRRSQPA
jgi:two-component system cell cycle response regulator